MQIVIYNRCAKVARFAKRHNTEEYLYLFIYLFPLPQKPSCIPYCKENQQVICNDKGLDCKCKCKNGYVEISDKCQEYNPCNGEHRKLKGQDNPQMCPKETECKIIGTNNDDFECLCKSGFFNEVGKFCTIVQTWRHDCTISEML